MLGENGTIQGPMTREWFLDACSLFTVSGEGKLLKDGLEVCQIWEDFEWTATVVLPTRKEVDLAFYTPERLVQDVREVFGMWHLDSYSRACALIDHFNLISPLPFDPTTSGLDHYARIRFPSFVAPPPYSLDLDNGFNSIPVHNSSRSLTSFATYIPSTMTPEDSVMDSEDGI